MAIPLKKLLSELSPVLINDYYLIISYDYVCLIALQFSGEMSFIQGRSISKENPAALSEFVKELKAGKSYYGQELTVLLAEPVSFNFIRDTKEHDLDDIREESNKLFGTHTPVKYQNFSHAGGNYSIAYGYDDEFVQGIRSILVAEKVFVARYYPLIGFILSEFRTALKESVGYLWSFGEFSVYLGKSPSGDIVYYESTGELSSDEMMLLTEKSDAHIDDVCHQSFTKRSLLGKKADDFLFKELATSSVRQLSLAIGSCKLLVSMCLILVLCLGATAIVTQIMRSNAEVMYLKYEDELVQLSALKRKVRKTKDELSEFEDGVVNSKQLSAGISKFCQRIPRGVVLDEIYSEKVDNMNVYFSIKGKAEKESAVFTYREFINTSFNYDCMEIHTISKTENQHDPLDHSKYKFTMAGK